MSVQAVVDGESPIHCSVVASVLVSISLLFPLNLRAFLWLQNIQAMCNTHTSKPVGSFWFWAWFLFLLLPCSSRSCWVAVMQHPNFETRHPLQTDEQQETGFDPLHNFNKNHSSTSTPMATHPTCSLDLGETLNMDSLTSNLSPWVHFEKQVKTLCWSIIS